MNPKNRVAAQALFNETKRVIANSNRVTLVVAPPAVFLHDLSRAYRGKRIAFAAQTVANTAEGPYTGDISAPQVRDAGATYTIIGHAERRHHGEIDADMRLKVNEALSAKLKVVLAVGEHERDTHGNYARTVRTQLLTALADVVPTKLKDITIAYEPVWAIGAAEAPDAHEVHKMMLLAHKVLVTEYGEKGAKVRILYGGAVNEENVEAISAVPTLGGVLVGRASLDPHALKGIVHACNRNT